MLWPHPAGGHRVPRLVPDGGGLAAGRAQAAWRLRAGGAAARSHEPPPRLRHVLDGILFVSVATLPLCLVLTSWLMWTLPVTWATSSWHGLPDDGLWLLHEWIFVHCGGHRAVVDSQPVRHMLLGLRVGDAAARWLIMQTPCHRYI